ncbi:MAG: hypothetical protein ACOY81_07655 [Bacillota bacterium]
MDFARYREIQETLLNLGQNILDLTSDEGEKVLKLLQEREALSREILQQLQDKLNRCLKHVTGLHRRVAPLQERLGALQKCPGWKEREIETLQELSHQLDALLTALAFVGGSLDADSSLATPATCQVAASREKDIPASSAHDGQESTHSQKTKNNHQNSPTPKLTLPTLKNMRISAPATLAELEQIVQVELKKRQTGLLST